MTDAIRVSGPINAAGLTMTLETGKLAQLAAGAVIVKVGDTTLLSTVATSKPREGIDFFPLTVDVEERMYAAGKIPGSFFRREGRPGEQAILTCRLTDRPLRPAFPEGFRNEVQVIATILGVDLENPHDIPSINGASAALTVSGIPFGGPIGAVRMAHLDGEWIAHPTYSDGDDSTFELVVAGRRTDSGDIAIMMVEAGGTENSWALYEQGAPKVTEETIAQGLEAAKEWIDASIELQLNLRAAVEAERGPIAAIPYDIHVDYSDEVFEAVAGEARDSTSGAMAIADKTDRNDRLAEIEAALLASLVGSADGRERRLPDHPPIGAFHRAPGRVSRRAGPAMGADPAPAERGAASGRTAGDRGRRARGALSGYRLRARCVALPPSSPASSVRAPPSPRTSRRTSAMPASPPRSRASSPRPSATRRSARCATRCRPVRSRRRSSPRASRGAGATSTWR